MKRKGEYFELTPDEARQGGLGLEEPSTYAAVIASVGVLAAMALVLIAVWAYA